MLFSDIRLNYLFENCGARRADLRPYFLRSFILGSRVKYPAFFRTGLAHNGHGWWYVENGQVDFAYTGTVTWYGTDYNVKSGQVMFGSIRF